MFFLPGFYILLLLNGRIILDKKELNDHKDDLVNPAYLDEDSPEGKRFLKEHKERVFKRVYSDPVIIKTLERLSKI